MGGQLFHRLAVERFLFTVMFVLLAVLGARADNFLKNGDFSAGKEAWTGDGDAVISDSGADPLGGVSGSGHGLTILLRTNEWSKVSQDFSIQAGNMVVNVTYSVSDDFDLSSRVEDYASAFDSLGLPAASQNSALRPGGWMAVLLDPATRSEYWAETAMPQAGSSGVQSTFRLPSQTNGTVTLMLAFPPGHGAVTLQEVVMEPESAASDPFGQGMSLSGEHKWAEAIACFDRVIAADPKNIRALWRRAYAKDMSGDRDGGIADYTTIITLDPKMALAYSARAFEKGQKYDSAGALADYDTALSIDPHQAVGYLNRGTEKFYMLNADGALTDDNSAIAEKADVPLYYKMRAYADYLKGIQTPSNATWPQKARDDALQSEKLASRDLDYYTHFLTYLIDSAQLGQGDAARQDLATFVHDRTGRPYPWGQQVGNYLSGQLPEDQFLKDALTAKTSWLVGHQCCEAFFYTGMQHLQSGDKVGAIGFFQQAVQTQHTRLCEFVFAKALLTQLQPTPVPAPAQ